MPSPLGQPIKDIAINNTLAISIIKIDFLIINPPLNLNFFIFFIIYIKSSAISLRILLAIRQIAQPQGGGGGGALPTRGRLIR